MKKALLFIFPVFLMLCLFAGSKQTKVKIVPLADISDTHIAAAQKMIQQYVPDVVVLPKEKLPEMAYYAPRKRYLADKLIRWLHDRAGNNEVFIGLTNKDISHANARSKNYGIMGLAIQPGKGCVASTFRVKDKQGFAKIVIHELAHTTGLPHCPNQGCYMMDAKGKNHTASLHDFCSKCKAHLRSKNWLNL